MQVNFTPMPATGEMKMTDAPPVTSPPTAEVQADGAESRGGTTDSQKGFRETMDDLLRRAESGDVDSGDQATSNPSEESEASDSEVALLEISAPRLQHQQNGESGLPIVAATEDPVGEAASGGKGQAGKLMQPQIDGAQADLLLEGEGDTSTPAAGNGNAATGSLENLKTFLQGEATESPKSTIQGDSTTFQNASTLRDASIEGVSKETVIDPKAAAELKTVPEPQVTSEAKVSSAPVEAVSPEASTVLLKSSGRGDAQAETSKNGSLKTQTDDGKKASQLLDSAVRAPQAQGRPGQEAALNTNNAARVVTMEEPAAKETQPQGFATLVESIEKGGAEAKPVNPVTENLMDLVGASGNKQAANTLSASSNVVKADAAIWQPATKEDVIRQIVDSAKLRFQSGRGEMRIQLKPESLGHVRLDISTDQHQVMVKVVAELPAVKELLESNLPHLRAELQGQGLEIHKFDVSVGGDSASQNKEQQTWAQHQNGRHGGGAFAQEDAENPNERRAPRNLQQPAAESESDRVDYFA
jgi:flagellar hook-length control protein FliK